MLRRPLRRLRVEALEDRTTPAISAALNAGVLTVSLSANDNVTVGGVAATGTDIAVVGTGFPQQNFSAVTSIVVNDTSGGGATNQRVGFADGGGATRVTLTGPVTVTGVESVNFNNPVNPMTASGFTVTGARAVNTINAVPQLTTGGTISITASGTGDAIGTAANPLRVTWTGSPNLTTNTSAGNGNQFFDFGGTLTNANSGTAGTVDAGTGTVTLTNGRLTGVAGNDFADNTSFNIGAGATLTFTGSEGVAGLSGTGNVQPNNPAATLVVGNANATSTFGGTLTNATLFGSGALSLRKVGTGTLTLGGGLSYSGTTQVAAGALVLTNRPVPTGSNINIAAGATLRYAVAITNVVQGATTITGTGTLAKTGAGALTFGGLGNVNWQLAAGGRIDVRAGTLIGGNFVQDNWTNNRSDLNVEAGATFDGIEANVLVDKITGAGTILTGYPGSGYRNFTFGVNNGSSTFGGVLGNSTNVPGTPGNFVKTGVGTITLAGANTYTGTTTVDAGILQIGNGGTTGTLGTGAVANNGAVVFNRSDTLTVPNAFGGFGTLTQAGTGATVLNGLVNNARASTSVFATAGSLLVNGTVAPGQHGPGTPTVVATGADPNNPTFLGGAGTVGGSVQVGANAVIGPGDPNATATLATGDLSFQPGGAFGVKVAGGGAGQFDALNVIGAVNLTGGGVFAVSTGAVPAPGSVLTVIANDGGDPVVGTFAGLPEGAALQDSAGNSYRVSYVGGTGNDVTLTAVAGGGGGGGRLISPLVVTGPADGNGSLFTAFNGSYGAAAQQSLIPGFGGELHVALGYVTNGLLPDLVVGTGAGDSRVRVLSVPLGRVLADFIAFPGYSGGVFVASGDLNGDGFADVAVTPDATDAFSGPVSNQLPVRVYSGASMQNGTNNPVLLAGFDGLASLSGLSGQNNAAVRLGGRPSIADLNGDGFPDLLVAAGSGGGPRVCVWDGRGFANAGGGRPTANPIANLFVFESTQRGGAFVTAGDVNGDGRAELIVGGGPGGGPRVRAVDSARLLVLPNLEGVDLDDPTNLANGLVRNNFFAGSANNRGGVRVTVRDVDLDGLADVVVGSGANERSGIQVYLAPALTAVTGSSIEPAAAQTLDPFGVTLASGVWVG